MAFTLSVLLNDTVNSQDYIACVVDVRMTMKHSHGMILATDAEVRRGKPVSVTFFLQHGPGADQQLVLICEWKVEVWI